MSAVVGAKVFDVTPTVLARTAHALALAGASGPSLDGKPTEDIDAFAAAFGGAKVEETWTVLGGRVALDYESAGGGPAELRVQAEAKAIGDFLVALQEANDIEPRVALEAAIEGVREIEKIGALASVLAANLGRFAATGELVTRIVVVTDAGDVDVPVQATAPWPRDPELVFDPGLAGRAPFSDARGVRVLAGPDTVAWDAVTARITLHARAIEALAWRLALAEQAGGAA